MRYRVLPYRQGSRSAKALAEALGGKVLKLENSKFKPKESDVVINWGNAGVNHGSFPQFFEASFEFLNFSTVVKRASNKLRFFEAMKDEDLTPKFWTNKDDIPDEAYPIVCRTVLAGHSGAGIVIANNREELVDAPLYTQYVKKKDEYRIHVGRTSDGIEVISVQRKARRLDTPDEEVNWQVRNHSNGFVYVREGVTPPPSVIDAAKRTLEVIGLDFGAVDLGYNHHTGRATVYEVNTAPGLEGETVNDYANFFKGIMND